MLDARHPGTVVGVVVLGSERLQVKARAAEGQRHDVVIRDERVVIGAGHRFSIWKQGPRALVMPRAGARRSTARERDLAMTAHAHDRAAAIG